MKLNIVHSKSIITPSKLPGADFVVNPYSGCAFGCVYCYADFTRKFRGHMDDKWGEYVDVRINTPELFAKELNSISKKVVKNNVFKTGSKPVIFFGSVTDPYQGVEAKYKLTRQCLEVISQSEINKDIEVSLLTKSHLVTRDIEVFKKIKNMEVGMTITSTDDNISKLFECNAPSSLVRLKALKQLNDKGINTYAFVGPLLPHFVANEKSLRKLFMEIKNTGTKTIWAEHINLSGPKMDRLVELIKDKVSNEELSAFKESQKDDYKLKLSQMVLDLVDEFELELVGGRVVDHLKF